MASAQASAADLAAARLSALGTLASSYVQLRAADAEAALLQSTVQGFERSLQIARNRYAAGIAANTDVLQAQRERDLALVHRAQEVLELRGDLVAAIGPHDPALPCRVPVHRRAQGAFHFPMAHTRPELLYLLHILHKVGEGLEVRPSAVDAGHVALHSNRFGNLLRHTSLLLISLTRFVVTPPGRSGWRLMHFLRLAALGNERHCVVRDVGSVRPERVRPMVRRYSERV